MNMQSEMWLFAVSVAASALGGMLGMASGIFIVPILTIFAHVDIRIAIGARLVALAAQMFLAASGNGLYRGMT